MLVVSKHNSAFSGQQYRIRVRGIVQGVGFRPLVFRLAQAEHIDGEVLNDAQGVLIHAAAQADVIDRFIGRMWSEAPPLARIDRIDREPYSGRLRPGFRIVASHQGPVATGVPPDAATCRACLAEIGDPANRRLGYPFTNCTECGPRFSIVRGIPYDRRQTSMAGFIMCDACHREFEDPVDRRFHAQPNACPGCGPKLWLEQREGDRFAVCETAPDALFETLQQRLQRGEILAIKGLGGFQLACLATDERVVRLLRQRKRRYAKPLALLARDIDSIEHFATPSDEERRLLLSPAAPIVLLRARTARHLAPAIAPGQFTLGFMLPSTPLHHLLMSGLDEPIVLTSGNRSDEPQCIDDEQARHDLLGIADCLVMHDREIVNRVDDSVVRVVDGALQPLRRARGYAPAPIALAEAFNALPEVLAFGGELKNTMCLLRGGEAIVSTHLGDLENTTAYRDFRESFGLFQRLYQAAPVAVAVDCHPSYRSSEFGRECADRASLPVVSVQHHHAHIAACLAENGVSPTTSPVLGIAFDGSGYGDDGTLWGGEWLLADYTSYRRLARFSPVALAGGLRAIHEPWRVAFAHLRKHFDWPDLCGRHAELPFFRMLAGKPCDTLGRMIDNAVNSPLTSSCGRLFDAVAALLGVRFTVAYEGQAAMELEALVDWAAFDAEIEHPGYTLSLQTPPAGGPVEVDTAKLWAALLADLIAGVEIGTIAARFHRCVADGVVSVTCELSRRYGQSGQSGQSRQARVALSGGVFQNAVLTEAVTAGLRQAGFDVLLHRRVPANDGGLALGQAVVAATRLVRSN